jgi:hypothetical protein
VLQDLVAVVEELAVEEETGDSSGRCNAGSPFTWNPREVEILFGKARNGGARGRQSGNERREMMDSAKREREGGREGGRVWHHG